MGFERETGSTNKRLKGDDIALRLLSFAVQVLKLVKSLPRDTPGRHLSKQLVRAATAGGANYEESALSGKSC